MTKLSKIRRENRDFKRRMKTIKEKSRLLAKEFKEIQIARERMKDKAEKSLRYEPDRRDDLMEEIAMHATCCDLGIYPLD